MKKKYKFPQFNVEITDPKVEIMMDSIQINPLNQTLSITITLTTSNAKVFGLPLNDIPRNSKSWDEVDLMACVMSKLSEYEIKIENE